MATGLVTPTEVDQLIQELSRGNSKKRQRAIVKDFVSLVMVAKIHDTSKLQLQGSEFAGHMPKVNTNATDDTARYLIFHIVVCGVLLLLLLLMCMLLILVLNMFLYFCFVSFSWFFFIIYCCYYY